VFDQISRSDSAACTASIATSSHGPRLSRCHCDRAGEVAGPLSVSDAGTTCSAINGNILARQEPD